MEVFTKLFKDEIYTILFGILLFLGSIGTLGSCVQDYISEYENRTELYPYEWGQVSYKTKEYLSIPQGVEKINVIVKYEIDRITIGEVIIEGKWLSKSTFESINGVKYYIKPTSIYFGEFRYSI